jgi:hypothetical protein
MDMGVHLQRKPGFVPPQTPFTLYFLSGRGSQRSRFSCFASKPLQSFCKEIGIDGFFQKIESTQFVADTAVWTHVNVIYNYPVPTDAFFSTTSIT